MLSKVAISMGLVVVLMTAPVYVSARTCIVSDSPVQKACQPDCCANKSCCATSTKAAAHLSQTLAKNGADSEFNATFAAALTTIAPGFVPLDRQSLTCTSECMSSTPQLAVLCTFLI